LGDTPRCRCWETSIGQELYKLVILTTLAEIFVIFTLEIARWMLHKITSCMGKIGFFYEKYVSNVNTV